MSEGLSKALIGFVCSNGHAQFVGESDYGVCGSKKVADIYVTVEALSAQYGSVMDAEDVAAPLEYIVRDWEELRDFKEWGKLD